MPTAPRNHCVRSLLLLLGLAVPLDASSAPPPPHKGVAPNSREGEAALGRASRALSRGEIFQAIHDDLARKGMQGSLDLRPEDLRVQYAAQVSGRDAGVQVKKIGFDAIRGETIFELWTSKQPQLLPFRVATRWDSRGAGLLSRYDRARMPESGMHVSAQTGRVLDPTKSRPPVLAKPGRPATLVMLGHNLRITLTVMPLQPGGKGQCILVRDTVNARVMRAEVVAEDLLRSSF